MSEWKEAKLSKIAELSKDSWKPGDEEAPYIGLEHIDEAKLRLLGTGHSREVNSNKYRFKNDEFLFGKLRPYFRKVVHPRINGICSTDIWVVKNKKEFDLDFVFYLFANQDFIDLAYSGSSGTRMPRADWKFMKDTEWLVPVHIEEQKAIADVLNSLDDKIDLLHRQNETLEAMAQTLFRQWFVEEAGDDWEEGCLEDIVENIRDSVKHDQVSNGTIYIGLKHIDKKNIALSRNGLSDNVKSNKYRFLEEDILFGKLRPYFHKVCFTPFSGICSTDILVIRPKNVSGFGFCLFAFFQEEVVEYANLGSGGTRMPRTNWNILKNYPILVPPDNVLKQFNDLIYPSVLKIKNNLQQIRTLEKLRDILLPKLMSGKVRVNFNEKKESN